MNERHQICPRCEGLGFVSTDCKCGDENGPGFRPAIRLALTLIRVHWTRIFAAIRKGAIVNATRYFLLALMLTLASCTPFLAGDIPPEEGPDTPQRIDPEHGPNFGP